jgi:flagellar FliL protein
MAKGEEKEDGEEKKEAAPKSKKKLIIIIALAVVLIGGGVGAFLAMGHKTEGEEGGDAAEAEEESAEKGGEEATAPPFVFALEPFIVNLQIKGSFLKTTIQLQFTEPEQPPHLESDVPKIRDAVIRILTAKSAQEILSSEGKEALREELKEALNEALGGEDITQVFFTEFIIQ